MPRRACSEGKGAVEGSERKEAVAGSERKGAVGDNKGGREMQ